MRKQIIAQFVQFVFINLWYDAKINKSMRPTKLEPRSNNYYKKNLNDKILSVVKSDNKKYQFIQLKGS